MNDVPSLEDLLDPMQNPKRCAVCRQPINEDGWGSHAYISSADGSQYTHHRCRPAPPPPAPPPAPKPRPAPPAPKVDLSLYLTLHTAAQLLGLSVVTLRRLVKSGRLPAFRLGEGKKILIERRALLALLRPVDQSLDDLPLTPRQVIHDGQRLED